MNTQALLGALWLAAAPCRSQAAERPSPARERVAEGLRLYGRGDIKNALEAFDEAVEQDPGLPAARAARALARLAWGDASRLDEDIAPALRAAGDDADTRAARGEALLLSGDAASALRELDQAVRLDPYEARMFLGRGRARLALGEYDKAAADWGLALRMDPGLAMARFDRAHARYLSGDRTGALRDLEAALRANAEFPLPYAMLGLLLAERGDLPRALQAYSKAIVLNPDYAYARIGRAAVYRAMGKPALAFRDYDQAIRSRPEDYVPRYHRGEAYRRAGDLARALGDFSAAAKLRIGYGPAAAAMGDALRDGGRAADALATYGKGVAAGAAAPPRLGEAWTDACLLRRADLERDLGRAEEAVADLRAAAARPLPSAAAWAELAELQLDLGLGAEARRSIDRALRLGPGSAPAHAALGRLFAGQELPEPALAQFDEAIRDDAGLAAAWRRRGDLRADAFADYARAAADLQHADRLAPGDPETLADLSRAYAELREFEKSAGAADAAVAAAPAEADPMPSAGALRARALAQRARVRAALGDSAEAAEDLRAALKARSEAGELRAALAELERRTLGPAEALRELAGARRAGSCLECRLAEGRARAMEGDDGGAAAQFRRAAELGPKSAEARRLLCRALRLTGSLRDAAAECRRAVELSPGDGASLLERGLTSLAAKEYDGAARDLERAAALGLRSARAMLALSLARAGRGQWQEADAAYAAAADLDPSARTVEPGFDAPPRPEDGYLSRLEGIRSAAADDLGSAPASVAYGDGFRSDGKIPRAVLEYTKALERDAAFEPAYARRCAARLEEGAFDDAAADCDRALRLAPSDRRAQAASLRVADARRKRLEAFGEDGGARSSAGSALWLEELGRLRLQRKDFAGAAEAFGRALSADPSAAAAYDGLGLAQAAQGGTSGALMSLSRAAAVDPANARYYGDRADVFLSLKRYADAAADDRRAAAASDDPDRTADYDKRRQAALEAAAAAEKSRAHSAETPPSRRGLGALRAEPSPSSN